MGLDLEGPRLQEASRKAGGQAWCQGGALPRGRASFSRAFGAGRPLEPTPLCSAGSHLGTRPWLWPEGCSPAPAPLPPSGRLFRVPVGRGSGLNPHPPTPQSAAAGAPG